MAQMPIQLLSGRADVYLAARNAQPVQRPAASLPATAYPIDPGGISGGALRPGALDQAEFKSYLASAQKEAVTAPPPLTKASPASAIPTLTPAQFAALGAIEQPAAAEPSGSLDGTALPPAPPASGTSAAAEPIAAPSAADVTASAAPAVTAPEAKGEPGPIPGSHRGADGVWELPRMPDKDERDMLRGQQWRIVENPESRKLFLGPDGEFGWDDFVDLINPLQHIPLVNVVYRAITGDKIYGAARMVDFAFGPLAGASTALDLAVQSTAGGSLVDNAVAALFGSGSGSAGAGSSGDLAAFDTAAGSSTQLADAGVPRHGSHQ